MGKRIFILIMAVMLSAFMLAGCGGKASDGIVTYDKTADFDLLRPADVAININASKIDRITLMSATMSSDLYTLKNGVLTFKKSAFENLDSGSKSIRIYIGSESYPLELRVFSATLHSAADFALVRNNPAGSFRLGEDIDFAGVPFEPIGKAQKMPFNGNFDGAGHAIKNVLISEKKKTVDSSGAVLDAAHNSENYNNGFFYSIGGNGIVQNVSFQNITLDSMGLSGAVAGTNGGTIRNCFVGVNISTGFGYGDSYYERAGGIAGVNGTNDSPGLIEDCIVLTRWVGGTPFQYRVFAEWNSGTIRNCRGATYDDQFGNMNTNKIDLFSEWYNDKEIINWQDSALMITDPASDNVNVNGDLAAGFYDGNYILPALGGSFTDNLVAYEGGTPQYCTHTYIENGVTINRDILINGIYINAAQTGTSACGDPTYAYKIFFPSGEIKTSYIIKMASMYKASSFDGFDRTVWEISDGSVPMLKAQN